MVFVWFYIDIFFCFVFLWCDLRKFILLLCILNVIIIFLFEVDIIIWFLRSKYCYNFFSELDYVFLYGFIRKKLYDLVICYVLYYKYVLYKKCEI